jgi:hypothetical protein
MARRLVKTKYKLKHGRAWNQQPGLKLQEAAAELDKLAATSGHQFDVDAAQKLANNPKNPLYSAVTHNADEALAKYQREQLRGLARSLIRVQEFNDGKTVETRMFTAVVIDDGTGDYDIVDGDASDGASVGSRPGAVVKHVYVSDIGISRDSVARIIALQEYARRIEWLRDGCNSVKELEDPKLREALDKALDRIRRSIRKLKGK